MSQMSPQGSVSLDTNGAVASVGNLINSLSGLSSSSLAAFASFEEVGSGLESLGEKLVGVVSNVVSTAASIQDAQAKLTTQSYNFGESLGQNQAQSKAMTAQLMQMATSIKAPTSQILNLASAVAQAGYSGQQIPALTKDFAEFGAVTGLAGTNYVKSITQIAQQTHTPVSGMNQLMSAVYALGKSTAGGTDQLLSMTDRMSGLSLTTGMTAPQFLALAATSEDFDSRLRGGAYGALQRFSNLLDDSLGKGGTSETAVQFFKFLGDGSATAGEQLAKSATHFQVFTTFLDKLSKQSTQGSFNVLENMGLTSATSGNITQGFTELANNQTGPSGKTLQSYMSIANQAWQSGSDVQTAYQAVMATTSAQITGLRDTVTQLANAIGTDLLPMFSAGAHIAQDFTSVLGLVPAPILAIAAGFAAVVGGGLAFAGIVTRAGAAIKVLVGNAAGIGGIGAGKTKDTTATDADTAAQGANTGSIDANTAAIQANTEAILARNAAMEAGAGLQFESLGAGAASSLAGPGAAATAGEAEAMSSKEAAIAGIVAAQNRLGAAERTAGAAATETKTAMAGLVATEEVGTASTGLLAGAWAGLAAALTSPMAALAAIAVTIAVVAHEASSAAAAGKAASQAFTGKFDTSSLDKMDVAINKTQASVDELKKKGEAGSLFGSFVTDASHFTDFSQSAKSYYQRGSQVKQDEAQIKDWKASVASATEIAKNFWNTANPTNDQVSQVLAAASSNMIDLGTNTKQTQQEVTSLLKTNATTYSSQNQDQLNALGQAASDLAQQNVSLAGSEDNVARAHIQAGEAARQLANYSQMVGEAQNQLAEAQTGVQAAALSTQQAVIQEGEAERQLGILSETLAEDQNKLYEAQLQVTAASLAAYKAQQAANEASAEQALTLENATLAVTQAQTQQSQSTQSLADAQWNLYKVSTDYALQYQQAINGVADTQLSLQKATLAAQNAQWQLTYLQQEGASNRDIQVAQLNLAEANQQLTDTTTNLAAQQQQLNQMPTDHANQLADATLAAQSAQNQTISSAQSLTQALINLQNAQQDAANNYGVQQANLALNEALAKEGDAAYGVTTAQLALNNAQDGATQLAYNQAVLAVTQSQQKEHDAAYSVVQQQLALNNLQDGSIQLAYKTAVDQVTTAQFALAGISEKISQDQAILNNNTMSVSDATLALANNLIDSGNPALVALGQNMLAAIPIMQQVQAQADSLTGPLDTTAASAMNLAGGFNAVANSVVNIAQANQQAAAITATLPVAVQNQGGAYTKVVQYAIGGLTTKKELAMIHPNELILPLNDPGRTQQLLQQAGLVGSDGTPRSALSTFPGRTGAVTTSHHAESHTVHNYYLNAITQPADPQEIVDRFAWQNRLVVT